MGSRLSVTNKRAGLSGLRELVRADYDRDIYTYVDAFLRGLSCL